MKSTGRSVPLIINPTLLFHLFRDKPDALLIQGGMVPNNFITLVYAKLTGTPIIWWSLGRVRGRRFRGLSSLYQSLNVWIEKHATCWVGYSSESVRYFHDQGYDPSACFNLINVVDTQLIDEKIKTVGSRVIKLQNELQLHNKKVVLFVGSITDTKGVDRLVKAFNEVSKKHDDAVLLIVGDGPERESISNQVTELCIQKRVIFTGAVYDGIELYFQLGDVMVLPGTGGLAVSEAMVHELPVICGIGDGVENDLVQDGVNGFVVDTDDCQVLAEKIDFVISDKERLQRMGEASRGIIDDAANIQSYMREMLSAISYSVRGDRL